MGKPVHFNGTSVGLTSRTGTGNDPYVEMDNGSLVAVSPANKARIRFNLGLGTYEQSINGGPWTPLGVSGSPTKEPTGFPNRTDSTLSFVGGGSRTFSITPTGVSFDYWIKGVKYTKNAVSSVVIANTEGLHYIYFNGTTLAETTAFSTALLSDYALVGYVYWDVSASAALLIGDERHEFMPWQTHYELHVCFGTQYLSGLALTNILADQTGALDTHAQLGVQAGSILDEDLIASIAVKAAPAQIPVYYRSGAAGEWNADAATNFPVKPFAVGGRLAYNQNTGVVWQQADPGTNNRFVLCHLFATNDIVSGRSIIAIQGQAFYASVLAARQGATEELLSLVTNGLPVVEFKPIATVIFETSTAYGNTIKARIRTTDTGANYVDWRGSRLSPVIVSLPGGFDTTAYHNNIPGEIAATPLKAVPVVNDILLIEDSAAASAKKSITIGSLPAGGAVAEQEVMYVGKHGNDANAGTSQGLAKLTIGAAIAACAAPAPNNQWRIEVLDGGQYSESITVPSYVHVHAPAANLKGHLVLSDYSSAEFYAIWPSTDGPNASAVYFGGSTYAFVRARYILANVSANPTYCVRTLTVPGATLFVEAGYCENLNTVVNSAVFYNDFQGRLVVTVEDVLCACKAWWSDNTLGQRDVFNARRVRADGTIPLGTFIIEISHGTAISIDYMDLASRAAPWTNGGPLLSYELSGRIGRFENYSTVYPATLYDNTRVNLHEKTIALHEGSIGPTAFGNGYYWASTAFNVYAGFALSIPREALAWRILVALVPSANEASMGGSIAADAAGADQIYNVRTWSNVNFATAQAGAINTLVKDDITAFFVGLLAGDSLRGKFAKRSGAASATWQLAHMIVEWIGGNG